MFTNTYLPHVGGVAESVRRFSEELRRRGHRVLIAAPVFENTPENEEDVVRAPAIQNFNGSDFSVRIPVPLYLHEALDRFRPEIVHSHHPFLMGDTALRAAAGRGLTPVFTHHTMYEQYTHYTPMDSPRMKTFVTELATGYANLCGRVIAPSESIADILRGRGVRTPVVSIPTGIDPGRFGRGDGIGARNAFHIPKDARVIGHAGRLAPEKNLAFLAEASAAAMEGRGDTYFLAVGDGPSRGEIEAAFRKRGLRDRLRLAGKLRGDELINAYHAMDVFVFASKSETQGMVLCEAMAAGVPVAALDAPGAREVTRDGRNGRLLPREDAAEFARAVQSLLDASPREREALCNGARETADRFSMDRCADRLEEVYRDLPGPPEHPPGRGDTLWEKSLNQIRAEWELIKKNAGAAAAALKEPGHAE